MRQRRAIIFDDSETVLGFFRDYFSLLNYEVLTFREPLLCPIYGNNAQACSRHAPCADIMITDYRMPRMDGASLLREQMRRGCKLAPENKALLSAHIGQDVIDSVTSLGFAFFRKPVMLPQLSAWVSGCEQRMDPDQPLGDRRQEQRAPVSQTEWYQLDREAVALACDVVNVSSSGICLRTPAPLQSAQVVYVTAGRDDSRAAVVRWSSRHDDGSYLSGLKCF